MWEIMDGGEVWNRFFWVILALIFVVCLLCIWLRSLFVDTVGVFVILRY